MRQFIMDLKESVNLNLIVLIIAALAIIIVLDEKTAITLNSNGLLIEKKITDQNYRKEEFKCP